MARLAEGHGHRGAGVPDGLRELLLAVQVAQRDVVHAMKTRGWTIATPPTVMSRSESLVAPPLTNAWAITTERPPRADRSALTRSMAAVSTPAWCAQRPERAGRHGGLEVGEGVDRDAIDQHGPADGRGGRPDVQSRSLEQPGGETEADGGVVVAAGQHDLRPRVDEAGDGLGEERDRVGRGEGPVVDVTGDQDGVDGLGAHGVDQVVDERSLGVEQPHLVERAPQVPVGGVDHAHVTQARRGHRHGP